MYLYFLIQCKKSFIKTMSVMKKLSIFVFVFLAVAQVLGGDVFGEKEEAITEIQKKLEEFDKLSGNLLNTIGHEKSKQRPEGETIAKKEGEQQKKQADENFEKQIIATMRTAIAKGKPLESIDCIERIDLEGKKLISDTNKIFIDTVENVWPNHLFTLDFNEKEVKLIKTATKELMDESIKKILSSKTGFQSLKTDALAKMETAKGRIKNIEARINKLNLPEVYTNLRTSIESKYKEVMDSLSKKLLKCVS